MERLRGIRGATTIEADTPLAIQEALVPMLQELVAENQIQTDQIVTVFFTITPDIHSVSPALVARTALDWQQVPLLCSKEPEIESLPHLCIRVLVQFYTLKNQLELKPVYHNRAAALRPDLGK